MDFCVGTVIMWKWKLGFVAHLSTERCFSKLITSLQLSLIAYALTFFGFEERPHPLKSGAMTR